MKRSRDFKNLRAVSSALLFGLCACQTIGPKATKLTLAEANKNGAQYRGQTVKVCGYATNQFENLQITEFRKDGYGDEKGASLCVTWSKDEPTTNGPEKRCVTGKLEPKMGWENYERKIAGEPHDLIISNACSGTDWEIQQFYLWRD